MPIEAAVWRMPAARAKIKTEVVVMNNSNLALLSILGPPARLNVEQTAVKLNCQVHDIRTLINARLLKPLGNPPPSGVKFFATAEVAELSSDVAWLDKATSAIHKHWKVQNEGRDRS